MFFPASGWFAAFLLTIAAEIPIVGYLLRAEPDRFRLGLLVVFANLVTHPAVWFIWTQLFLVGTLSYTLAAESWAVVAEAVFYWTAIKGLSVRRAMTVAVAANAASFLLGQLVGELWPDLFR